MRAAGVPLVPGAEGTASAARGARGRRRARLPGAAEGGRGRRRRGMRLVTAPDELEDAYAQAVERGDGGVLGRHALRREGDLAGAPRRDPGALRRARRRADLRRARVLDPAAAPEADRGVAVAGARRGAPRGDGGRRRARVPAHRLPQRGHVRVPRRPRRLVLVHRAERAPPGRASGHRARDGARPRARAGAHRRGRAAADHRARAALRARDRDPDQRRGPVARLHAGAGTARALPAAARAGRARRHVRRGGLRDPAELRLADREGDRARRHARPAIERARRVLAEFEIAGVPTTRDVALEILDSPEFRSGEYSTSFLEEAGARLPSFAAA